MSGRPAIQDGWRVRTAEQVAAADDPARFGDDERLGYYDWLRVVNRQPTAEQDFWWRLHELFGRRNEATKRRFGELYDLGGES